MPIQPKELFPRATDYRRAIMDAQSLVREEETDYLPILGERHIQCAWFDPALRPDRLRTTSGEWATIENPGVWNLEAGPDFLGAVLLLDGQRRISGDVEIHLHPSDWSRHGHQTDPRYKRVRFHVTYHPGPIPSPDLFPPGIIHIHLHNNHEGMREIHFEGIDLTAYPYHVVGVSPPCQAALQKLHPDQAGALLDAAGEERLRQKSQRMRHATRQASAEIVLYRELFYALGFKHNRTAFRRLASLLPEERLREAATETEAYAILAGVSGLLPTDMNASWSPEARMFLKSVWDCWWRIQEAWPERMNRNEWSLAGIRPFNHPLRRLMAAVRLFHAAPPLFQRLPEAILPDGSPCLKKLAACLQAPGNSFWDHHESLSAPGRAGCVALLGDGRAGSIITNILIPFLAATRGVTPSRELLDHLPAEPDNSIVRQTVHALFGRDCPSSLYRSTLRRQGLLQLFSDFCLTDRSRCAACTLPETARTWGRSPAQPCTPLNVKQ